MQARLLVRFVFLMIGLIALPELPQAASNPVATARPNVLFIAIDDLRSDLGCLGVAHARTPNLDRLAAAGRLFTRHYVNVPTCGASRYTMFRGRYPTDPVHRGNGAIRDSHTTWAGRSLPAWFRQHGYRTFALGKVTHHPGGLTGPQWASGPDELPDAWERSWVPDSPWKSPEAMMHGYANGKPRIPGTSPAWEAVDGPDHTYPDAWIADEAIRTLRQLADSDRPWFFAVGFFKPHLPFAAPQRYFGLHDPDQIPAPALFQKPSPPSSWHPSAELRKNYGHEGLDPDTHPEYARQLRHACTAATSYVDAQVGRVLDGFEQLDLARNTIVIVWSDHGFLLGEHAIWGKHALYELALRSPLIIRTPTLGRPGQPTPAIVETVDLFPTLTDLCSLPAPPGLDGRSLTPQLADPAAPSQKPALGFWANQQTLRTDRWRLILHRSSDPTRPAAELFDHATDPDEGHNLAAAKPEIVQQLAHQLTTSTRSRRPNILVAIADDWSAHAGAYGTPWIQTPAFDRLARHGLLFNRAFTPNAKCAPSRAILLTGRHSWQLDAAANHMAFFPARFKSYPEALAEHGYFVGSTGKGWGPGTALDPQGRPRPLVGPAFSRRTAPPPTPHINRNDYASNFADFLEAAPPDEPWCFWFGATEPHRPYEFRSGTALAAKRLDQINRVPGYWPDHDTIRHDLLDYALEVEHVDRHVARMLDQLERRGELDRTLIVYTSDHGMPFPRVKGQAYLHSNHVPLAIHWPSGIPHPGRIIDDFVDFTDLAPTFLDVAGIPAELSGMASITGQSLRPILDANRSGQVLPHRDHVLIGKERHDVGRPNEVGYPIRGLIQDHFLYLRNFEPDRWPAGNPETGYLNTDGSPTKTFMLDANRRQPNDPYWILNFGKRPAEELYDLALDPDCVRNLAQHLDHHERRTRMHTQLTRALAAQGDPRITGHDLRFDQYPIATESLRDFYERFRRGERIPTPWVNDSDFERAPNDDAP
jgi:N-sulfoglucosamine sulfohydrolase